MYNFKKQRKICFIVRTKSEFKMIYLVCQRKPSHTERLVKIIIKKKTKQNNKIKYNHQMRYRIYVIRFMFNKYRTFSTYLLQIKRSFYLTENIYISWFSFKNCNCILFAYQFFINLNKCLFSVRYF